MATYTVNATISAIGWATVEADTPEEAAEAAYDLDASDFATDSGTAEVEFNVSPMIEPA